VSKHLTFISTTSCDTSWP